jgi:Subtilase family/Peptidase inhibitor I9
VFIQRFVLILAAIAAAAPLPAQTIVTNGGFKLTSTRARGDWLVQNRVGAWRVAYGAPQLIVAKGCGDPNYIALSGNKAAGDAIQQPVALMKGVPYEVSLCVRYRKDEIQTARAQGKFQNAHVALRASTMPLGGAECLAPACETMTGAKNVIATQWRVHQFQITPSRDYSYLTISTGNDTSSQSIDPAVDHGAKDWRAEVDNVSVTLAVRPGRPAPVINADAQNKILDQYIVLLRPGTTVTQAKRLEREVTESGGTILNRYHTGVLGFAAHLEQDALKMVRANRLVLWVEADQTMSSSAVTGPTSSSGIDRIDQRLFPLNRTFQYTETGEGVHAYVLDTGIRTTHQEFGGRASSDFTAADNDGSEDCSGHGTHVAGTLGGSNYGIARNVRLHSVRVMDCQGQGNLSNVIAGVTWITAEHNKCRAKRRPAVANMSISAETMVPSLDVKIQESIASGVTYVVAAHNRARDACHYSPARIPDAITVGAVNQETDMRWVMSNVGPCVDLFAPGVAIPSADKDDDKDTASKAGTSMATAFVAGVAALALQLDPRAKPSDVWNKIHDNDNVSTTPGWPGIIDWQGLIDETGTIIKGVGSPNELLHWGPFNGGYDDAPPPWP